MKHYKLEPKNDGAAETFFSSKTHIQHYSLSTLAEYVEKCDKKQEI